MKKNTYLKPLRIFFIFFALVLFGITALVVVIDPFFQYHKPLNNVYYTIDNQLSQNPGMAKNFEYDSVVLGSSMTVNFDTNLFQETMGLNTLKLSYNGAFPKDIDNIMEIIQESPNEVKEVFLGVDIYTYKATPGITAYEIPSYLYDDNLLNDVAYIFNKEVLIEYILIPQFKKNNTPLNEIYWSWPYQTYGAGAIAASYNAPTEFVEMLPADAYAANIRENMEQYIIPYIEQNPDTQFTIFFPPYSILYWYNHAADGSLVAEIQGEKQIVEMLLDYPNVRIFYFQNQFETITNLDNYCDYTHYTREINDYMTQCFANGDLEITSESYEAIFDEMLDFMLNCDFSAYWSAH